MKSAKKNLPAEQRNTFTSLLRKRFVENMNRHPDVRWAEVEEKLTLNEGKVWILHEMEITGGEPDVIGYDHVTREAVFCDCAAESPKGRRSLCYDREALESRKENKPDGSAVGTAEAMGIDMLTEEEYRALQTLGKFDTKTSSWVRTPAAIRKLGGALFCDRRYDAVFVYHNGAESYYAARGFRGQLKV